MSPLNTMLMLSAEGGGVGGLLSTAAVPQAMMVLNGKQCSSLWHTLLVVPQKKNEPSLLGTRDAYTLTQQRKRVITRRFVLSGSY